MEGRKESGSQDDIVRTVLGDGVETLRADVKLSDATVKVCATVVGCRREKHF